MSKIITRAFWIVLVASASPLITLGSCQQEPGGGNFWFTTTDGEEISDFLDDIFDD